MKILYVGNFTPKNSPLGYCPNADYISDTFEQLGHSVTRWNECDYDSGDVLLEIMKNKYSFLLCEEGRLRGDHHSSRNGKNVIEGYFLKVVKESKVPVVSWLSNIFWDVMNREPELKTNPIFKADIVFSTDGGHEEDFKRMGINHRLLRQGIYQKEAYLGKPIYPTQSSIGFVGSIYQHIWPYRAKLIHWLIEQYSARFSHFGQNGEIRHDNLNNLCATLKIVVGDSVYSTQYWSNRIYEIIGRGGFLITPMVDGLDKEFIPFKHFVPYTFGDFKDLKEKIDYYLVHNKEREKIRIDGFNHCKENHTYMHRAKDLLRILKEEKII